MAVDICVLAGQGVLEVTYRPGGVTQADLSNDRAMAADAVREHSCRRILVDATKLERMPPLWATLDHNAAVSAEEAFRQVRFAVVFRSLGPDERFLETSGQNRGVQIRCFASRDAAVSWLTDEPDLDCPPP